MRRTKEMRMTTKLRLRKSTRAIVVIIALVLFVMSLSNLYANIFQKGNISIKRNIYDYSNNYQMDYKVNIKQNKFITDASLPANQTYVSDLIDSLDMNIKYKYDSSKNTEVKYKYKIDAIITASYSSNGENYNVWTKNYNLVNSEEQISSQNIEISEYININYPTYHEEVKQFKQAMGMTLEADLVVRLTVDTSTNVEGENVENKYISDFYITIGDKIANVNGKAIDSTKDSITGDTIMDAESNTLSIVINVIIICIAAYTIYFITLKTKTSYNIRNEFKFELNRILKSCQDRIVIVKNRVELEQENTIEVRDFGELIKLSEELYKPILYWISENNEEAHFSVVSNKINYRFILKK